MVYHLHGRVREDIAAIGFLPFEAFGLQLKGSPIPAAMIPTTLEFEGRGKMPDLYEWQVDQFIVSHKGRQILEAIAPADHFEFIQIRLAGSGLERSSDNFFFMNLLTVEPRVDWAQTDYGKTEKLPDGRVLVLGPQSWHRKQVFFKPLPQVHLWHEARLETETHIFSYSTQSICITNSVHAYLRKQLPGQLNCKKLQTD